MKKIILISIIFCAFLWFSFGENKLIYKEKNISQQTNKIIKKNKTSKIDSYSLIKMVKNKYKNDFEFFLNAPIEFKSYVYYIADKNTILDINSFSNNLESYLSEDNFLYFNERATRLIFLEWTIRPQWFFYNNIFLNKRWKKDKIKMEIADNNMRKIYSLIDIYSNNFIKKNLYRMSNYTGDLYFTVIPWPASYYRYFFDRIDNSVYWNVGNRFIGYVISWANKNTIKYFNNDYNLWNPYLYDNRNIYCWPFLLSGEDPNKFRIINIWYEKLWVWNYIYKDCLRYNTSNWNTFEIVTWNYWKDKNNLYCKRQIIDWQISNNISIYEDKYVKYWNKYYDDDCKILEDEIVNEFDIPSLFWWSKKLSNWYKKDWNIVDYNWKKIVWADPYSFKQIESSNYFSDKNWVYYKWKKYHQIQIVSKFL